MAFATVPDLATRLGRSLTATETGQASAFLEDATGLLQSHIGQLVEPGTATVSLPVLDAYERIRLPQWPVTAVSSVSVNGTAITDYELIDGHLLRAGGWLPAATSVACTVQVTFSYGYTPIPPELVTWTIVMAAGALAQAKRGSLSAAGIASERVADYAVNYSADSDPFALPEKVLDRLRAKYGTGVSVVTSR